MHFAFCILHFYNMSKKIIFIEDESELQRMVTGILAKDGYQVFAALDGETGLKLVEKELPDLVLLDLILPKKDGFEVLRELKQNEKTKKIPVIILTNLEGGTEIEKVLSLGATTYLVKTNYRLQEVIEKIKSILG